MQSPSPIPVPPSDSASPPPPVRSGSLRTLYMMQAGYLAFIFALFTIKGMGLTPDIIFLILAFGFTWRGNRVAFIRDFAPFVLLLLSYDAMRGYADNLGGAPHITYPIKIDRFIFGEVPTVALQRWFFDPQHPHWYDYGAALLHILHFIVPLFFAAILWQHYRKHYWPFVISLVVLSYAGFVTFLLLPTAPPWYAGYVGVLPGAHLVHQALPAIAGVYRFLSPNDFASMPSLHAAYPWLFFLFSVRIWGKRALPLLLYVAAVYLAIVYLGHHYVIDVLAGMAYASVAYVVCATSVVSSRVRRLWSLLRPARQTVETELPLPERKAA